MDITETSVMPRWGSLTYELGRSASPILVYLKKRYPNVRPIQQRYRDGAGSIVIGSGGAHPGTLGTAFDWAIRFLLHPQPSPDLALSGVWGRMQALSDAAVEMTLRLGVTADHNGHLGVRTFTGPAAGSRTNRQLLWRGCWALALLTEIYRTGGIHPQSALAQLDLSRVTADELLAIAPVAAVDELGALCDLAAANLLSPLGNRSGQWALGPSFIGSALMHADADFIAAGLLVEMKTGLGDKRSDGTRRAGLDSPTLYQMIGYALLDFTDEYRLDTIALYSARYRNLTLWPLREVLGELAGRDIDLAMERDAMRAVLQGRA